MRSAYAGRMRNFVVYGLLRLGIWAVLWWLLAAVGMGVILAGLVAALISMMISFLFLSRTRDRAAMSWKDADDRRRARKGGVGAEDAEEEDSAIEAAIQGEDERRQSRGPAAQLPALDADRDAGSDADAEADDAAADEADRRSGD